MRPVWLRQTGLSLLWPGGREPQDPAVANSACVLHRSAWPNGLHPSYQAMLSIISPQTSAKVIGGYGTAVDHVLAMAFDDPDMDDDLRRTLDAHEVVLDGERPDVW